MISSTPGIGINGPFLFPLPLVVVVVRSFTELTTRLANTASNSGIDSPRNTRSISERSNVSYFNNAAANNSNSGLCDSNKAAVRIREA